MARSYKKTIRLGFGVGSNTWYYRNKRKTYRAMYKSNIARAMKSKNPDDNYVHPEFTGQFKDAWSEPTDGSWLITPEKVTDKKIENFPTLKDLRRHLKRFHCGKWNYKRHIQKCCTSSKR